ncbi:substrate-binding domain-containing protein [Streptomyces sp. NPDC002514]|uniref:substrate-binding domain-containing protein n=1 Tax=Streptomyces sp. NPDC001270 TaxID=3364554 RepID=UPI0036A418FD
MKRLVLRSALREARRLGREVPADLGVIGFDGQQLGALVEPPLSNRRSTLVASAHSPWNTSDGC